MKVTRLAGNPLYINAKVLHEGNYTIERADVRTLGNEDRLVLTFEHSDRELKLTPAQVSRMIRAHGDDTDGWVGKVVALTKPQSGKGVDLSTEPMADAPERPKRKSKSEAAA